MLLAAQQQRAAEAARDTPAARAAYRAAWAHAEGLPPAARFAAAQAAYAATSFA